MIMNLIRGFQRPLIALLYMDNHIINPRKHGIRKYPCVLLVGVADNEFYVICFCVLGMVFWIGSGVKYWIIWPDW